MWGIDLWNVRTPADVTDLSFARDWGFNVQIPDVLLATRIARIARTITLQGMGGIIVGGHNAGQLEPLVLAPWARQRRQDLLDLLDQLTPKIHQLTRRSEEMMEQRVAARRLPTHLYHQLACHTLRCERLPTKLLPVVQHHRFRQNDRSITAQSASARRGFSRYSSSLHK